MGEDAVRLEDGRFIGVQYWPTLEHVAKWRKDFEHGIAIDGGWKLWYEYYELRITKVEIAKSFYPDGQPNDLADTASHHSSGTGLTTASAQELATDRG
jgi:hypothetical protein